ncbi:MAG: RNA polymerase sigma factor [Clostridia bacterium]|nr:RNA polymerase sigma factor [Clostridia bacterium]MBQ2730727.1 RNA polymerase sigma factor [Clostridia bacterium]
MDQGAQDYFRYLEGDDEGLVRVIEAYKDPLILYVCGFVKDVWLAEDLVEDTFLKLVVKKPRFLGKSSFKTWLFATARNLALDHLRRAKRTQTVPLSEVQVADVQSIEEACFQKESALILHRAMKRLAPDYQSVLFLVYFENFSLDEASTVLKKRKKQTENLLYRAKGALRKLLEQEGYRYEELT